MPVTAKPRYTLEEYFRLEDAPEGILHEFCDGEVFEMEAASKAHQDIVLNLGHFLKPALRPTGCRVRLSIRIATGGKGARGLYTYPDLSLFCGTPAPSPVNADTFLNPRVLIEVLSPSTRDYDAGTKFAFYRQIGSLQEYVTVDQMSPHVTHYRRADSGGWAFRDLEGLDSVLRLESIGIEIPFTAIFDEIEFPAEDP